MPIPRVTALMPEDHDPPVSDLQAPARLAPRILRSGETTPEGHRSSISGSRTRTRAANRPERCIERPPHGRRDEEARAGRDHQAPPWRLRRFTAVRDVRHASVDLNVEG